MSLDVIKKAIFASIETKQLLLSQDNIINQIAMLAEECATALRSGGKIIFCGNGGSFADAQHLSAEFVSRFMFDRPAAASLALGTNSSAMSAIGNDYGYDQVFARELSAVAVASDLFIPISTSGNSANVIRACEVAVDLGVKTFAFSGQNRGRFPDGVEVLRAPSLDTARIQECHILMGHIVCEIVEQEIFGSEN